MQLIPSILNSKFGHLGGVAEVKKLLGLQKGDRNNGTESSNFW